MRGNRVKTMYVRATVRSARENIRNPLTAHNGDGYKSPGGEHRTNSPTNGSAR